jgi:hypothetical protein
MVAYIRDRVEEYSPEWAVRILGSTSQHYDLIAKAVNDTIELWCTPVEWFKDNTLPVAYETVLKEWITYPGVEVFIAPVLDLKAGIEIAQAIFERELVGQRVPNPENPGGHITVVTGKDDEYPVVQRSFAIWEEPRQIHEQFNRRIFEISSRVEPANAKFAEFLGRYSEEEVITITLGLAPAESGCFRP